SANGTGVILNSGGNTIGSTDTAAANTISGNAGAGVSITGAVATGNLLLGNSIRTNNCGVIVDSQGNTIGGTATGEGNTIFLNTTAGVSITGAAASANLLLGNGIIANDVGVTIDSGSNTIGGAADGAGNAISGNNAVGVSIS